jgi:two-component system, chemotaxis family, response regulator Rcp1
MNKSEAHRLVRVLLVEDNPGDVDLVLDVLGASQWPVAVTVAIDGVDALERLAAPGDLPDLVILDLNLPKKDGRAVLREMKADPRLRRIPVVVLSSSEADRDLRDAYDLQASCFVTKPAELDDFFTAVRGIEQFWLRVVKLPPSGEPRATPEMGG